MNEFDWGYYVPKVILIDSDEGMKVRRRAIWSSVCARESGEKLGWRQTITRTAVEEHRDTASGNLSLKASEFE